MWLLSFLQPTSPDIFPFTSLCFFYTSSSLASLSLAVSFIACLHHHSIPSSVSQDWWYDCECVCTDKLSIATRKHEYAECDWTFLRVCVCLSLSLSPTLSLLFHNMYQLEGDHLGDLEKVSSPWWNESIHSPSHLGNRTQGNLTEQQPATVSHGTTLEEVQTTCCIIISAKQFAQA